MKSYSTKTIWSVFLIFAILLLSNTNIVAYQVTHTTFVTLNNAIPNGGPRTVVQGMNDIQVSQSTNDYLLVSITNATSEVVYQTSTYDQKTIISTVGWASGPYRVHTVDATGDVQVFNINIE